VVNHLDENGMTIQDRNMWYLRGFGQQLLRHKMIKPFHAEHKPVRFERRMSLLDTRALRHGVQGLI
jgi:hypothetical protein